MIPAQSPFVLSLSKHCLSLRPNSRRKAALRQAQGERAEGGVAQ